MVRNFKARPILRWSDIAWTVIPLLLWLAGIYARSLVIQPHCVAQPQQCAVANLYPMDRPAVGLEVPGADSVSFTTQGLSAVIALATPPLWHGALWIAGRATPLAALIGLGTDLVIFTQTTAWNGLLTESAHLWVQRPRPFVYADPVRARDFSNYTSFYSGHTSFSAAATVFVFLTLLGRNAPLWLLGLAGTVSYSLMSLTGLFRVLAGRHFPTDVWVAAIMGTGVAAFIAYRHRDRALRPEPPRAATDPLDPRDGRHN